MLPAELFIVHAEADDYDSTPEPIAVVETEALAEAMVDGIKRWLDEAPRDKKGYIIGTLPWPFPGEIPTEFTCFRSGLSASFTRVPTWGGA